MPFSIAKQHILNIQGRTELQDPGVFVGIFENETSTGFIAKICDELPDNTCLPLTLDDNNNNVYVW